MRQDVAHVRGIVREEAGAQILRPAIAVVQRLGQVGIAIQYLLGEGTAQGKAVGHEGGNHLSHVDVHHHGPFGNGHETAQGVEGCFFGNAGKSQFLHNRNEFRVFFHQVMYVFCKINDF